MMNPFECTRRFAYRTAKPDLTVGFPSIISTVLEASLLHTESTPFPMAWYAENNVGFLLTNWQVRVLKQPRWNDEMTIRTWPCFFKGVVAERSFAAYDQSGAPLLQANSGWAFMDLARRRPVRPSAPVIESYGIVAPHALAKDFKLPDTEGFKLLRSREFTVARRDIDTNGHANNASYIEWAMEDIPDNVYDRLGVVEMKTAYRRECVRGAALAAETLADPCDENAFAVHIKSREQEGALLCEMFFRFG